MSDLEIRIGALRHGKTVAALNELLRHFEYRSDDTTPVIIFADDLRQAIADDPRFDDFRDRIVAPKDKGARLISIKSRV